MDAAGRNLAGLRLLQVLPSLAQGGAERVATTLVLALAREVERLVVCSSGGEPFEGVLRASGVPFERIPRPWLRPAPFLRTALALARVLRRERPHVVHAHNPAAAAAAALARALARLPETAIVTTFHGVVPSRVGRASRALVLSSDLVVGVGPASTRALVEAGLPPERSLTIFNAVDVQVRRGAGEVRASLGAEGVPLVVTVGRYVEEKNQALLLDALVLLRRPLRALLVGYGPLEEELRRRSRSLGLGAAVAVTGRREDAADLIAAADVFVLSSASEGLPLVLLEAMSLGTPVVSTDVGGVRDAVEHERTGLLAPAGDAAALAAAIARILDEPGLGDRLAAEGRRLVRERCSPEAMVAGYRAAYADALGRRRRASARRAGASPSK